MALTDTGISAGNTVAVKMPGQTALVANLVAQIIAEVSSLPRGVVSIFTESGNAGAPGGGTRFVAKGSHGHEGAPGSTRRSEAPVNPARFTYK
jgi:acyl-CoA reductase-like NAD-dependent aldehyde dehydrogenase